MTPVVAVLRVVNDAPQVQVTWVSTYSGWMSFFMVSSHRPPGRPLPASGREPEPAHDCVMGPNAVVIGVVPSGVASAGVLPTRGRGVRPRYADWSPTADRERSHVRFVTNRRPSRDVIRFGP